MFIKIKILLIVFLSIGALSYTYFFLLKKKNPFNSHNKLQEGVFKEASKDIHIEESHQKTKIKHKKREKCSNKRRKI